MYPVVREPRILIHQPEESILMVKVRDFGEAALVVNELAGDILERCNGALSDADIASRLVSSGAIQAGDEKLVIEFLEKAFSKGLINDLDSPANTSVKVLGSRHYWTPSLIILELTHRCNLFCRYCYREAGSPNCEGFADSDRAKRLIHEMAELGIGRIQLTGGEPTMHPHFADILSSCIGSGVFVNVITNGCDLPKDCEHALENLDPRCGVVQVSIDGSRETHDAIRGRKGSYDSASKLVSRLTRHGVAVDVAATVWGQSYEDLEHVCRLAKKLGARSFRASPLFEAGRAAHGVDRVAQKYVLDFLNSMSSSYADDSFMVGSFSEDCLKESHRANICGAGSRVLRVTPSFAVKPCPLLDCTIGEIAEDGLEELLKTKNKKYDSLVSPSPDICDQCEKSVDCDGCFKRAMLISEKVAGCAWRAANLNNLEILK